MTWTIVRHQQKVTVPSMIAEAANDQITAGRVDLPAERADRRVLEDSSCIHLDSRVRRPSLNSLPPLDSKNMNGNPRSAAEPARFKGNSLAM